MSTRRNLRKSFAPPLWLPALASLALSLVTPPAHGAAAPVTLTLKGQWPGYQRAMAHDFAVQGRYAYLPTNGGGLVVLDVAEPANPARVGTYNEPVELWLAPGAVTASGHYVYIVESGQLFQNGVLTSRSRLKVIDVTKPTLPSRVGPDLDLGDFIPWDVVVSGNHVYVPGGQWNEGTMDGLQVVSVEHPGSPFIVATYEAGSRLHRVAVSGDHAYAADENCDLHVINIRDPVHPTRVGIHDFGTSVIDLAVSGNHAYLSTAGGGGVQVLDISDPTSPVLVGRSEPWGLDADESFVHERFNAVAVAGTYAYVAETGWGGEFGHIALHRVRALDVSDPAHPVAVAVKDLDVHDGVRRIAVVGDFAYLLGLPCYPACPGESLHVLDVSDPTNPERVGGYHTDGGASGVALSDNYAYLADGVAGLQVIDVSNPGQPLLVGTHPGRASDVVVSGNHAYVAAYDAGLQVIDVSDPVDPVRAGGYHDDRDQAYGGAVEISGTSVYWVHSRNLQVLDVSDAANPVRVGRYDTGGYARDVAVVGNYAYVIADGDAGLQLIDVSDPANPVRVGGYDRSGAAGGVAVAGNYAYVADWEGLQVIDVTDPANPVRVGGYDTSGYGRAVAVMGHYAYLAEDGAVHVLDLSDPANPVRVGGYETRGIAYGVAVMGNLICVADGPWGLTILELSRPPWLKVSRLNPFSFRVSGEPGASIRVQRSANLTDWTDWRTVTLGEGPVEITDSDATPTGARFYRALAP